MLRVGLVIKEFDAQRGGAERYGVTLASELTALGHEVHVYCHRASEEPPPGIEIHLVPVRSWPATLRFLSFPREASRAYRHSGLDVIHGLTQVSPQDVHRAGGGVHRTWVRIARPNPISRAIHQATPRELARRAIEASIYRRGNYALIETNSELVRGHVLDQFDVPPERVVVVRNGVDARTFHPGVSHHRESVRRELGLSADGFTVLLASSNFARKGLATLLGATQRCRRRGLEVAVVAAGAARADRYRELARNLSLASCVRFPGHVGAIESLYGAADVFVLPTLYDPCANCCIEAMACGLPVVTTRTNGASELLEHGKSGFVLEDPRDDEALALHLLELADRERRREMGRRASAVAGALSPRKNAEETALLYRKAMELRDWDWR